MKVRPLVNSASFELCCLRLALIVLVLGAVAASTPAFAEAQPVSAIFVNGNIETMDSTGTVAQAVAINDGKFVAVGSTATILAQYKSANIFDLQGETVLPGFIDTHSHMQGWGGLTDPAHWLDLSTVNVFLKPLPTDKVRCTNPTDPQFCFIPVQTQEDAIARLTAAVAKAKPEDMVLATMYDPARLGHGPSCPGGPGKLGFDCPNFEDGNARAYLDKVSTNIPIFVGSQSGHIAYVNTAFLKNLNICGTDVATSNCASLDCTQTRLTQPYPGVFKKCVKAALPLSYPQEEVMMANLGQLNEDLSGAAQGAAITYVVARDSAFTKRTFNYAVETYANQGFTFAQEGLAGDAQVLAYLLLMGQNRPLTAALLYNDGSGPNGIASELSKARLYRALTVGSRDLILHGIKELSDGSNQGYTGYLLPRTTDGVTYGYAKLYYPFTDPTIFPPLHFGDPYLGVPDSTVSILADHARQAHASGFPVGVHQNGDNAIAYTLQAFQQSPAPSGLRDIMIHFSLASAADLNTAKSMDAGVTFLITNLYYYGLPLCQQVLGPARTLPIYPTGDAEKAGLRFGLHADSPVGAPDALFMIWVAATRKTQQPSWYPNLDPQRCPLVMAPQQKISIRQGVKAFTSDAAYVYGREKQIGSIEVGKVADMVRLSKNPLQMENDPDELKTIHILGTVHRGVRHDNPHPEYTPIWPE